MSSSMGGTWSYIHLYFDGGASSQEMSIVELIRVANLIQFLEENPMALRGASKTLFDVCTDAVIMRTSQHAVVCQRWYDVFLAPRVCRFLNQRMLLQLRTASLTSFHCVANALLEQTSRGRANPLVIINIDETDSDIEFLGVDPK